jgi:hypothetical protein
VLDRRRLRAARRLPAGDDGEDAQLGQVPGDVGRQLEAGRVRGIGILEHEEHRRLRRSMLDE